MATSTGGIIDDPTEDTNQPRPSGYVAPTEPPTGDGEERQEEVLVRRLQTEWDDARKFDEPFREQVALDRRYAAGTADMTWAVNTNVIGSHIDTLNALLYARDPDVSVRKAPSTNEDGTFNFEQFALTTQIIVSHLWRRARLRQRARKVLRSALSNSEGWFKANLRSDKVPRPAMETKLHDAQETLERLHAFHDLLEDPGDDDPETREARMEEIEENVEELKSGIEQSVVKALAIDFVRTENMQVSPDVDSIEDYLDADWCGNELFMLKDRALSMFPRLTPKDLDVAELYYRSPPKRKQTRDGDELMPQGEITAESALAFNRGSNQSETKPYLHVIEIWDSRDKHIKTMIEGVKRWAVPPYEPPYPTSRFYPYFYFGLFEVDGERHSQSLSWRLSKLQDEYGASRSSFRLTRERSIPGVLFNRTGLSDEEIKRIQSGKHQEFIGIAPLNPNEPVGNLFAAKPTATVDMRLFDPTLVLNDMERVSGVQEALSAANAAPGNPVTATEASIQQQGTSARTTSARDTEEWALSDFAQYTTEQALQCFTVQDAQRIAGPKAFWPGPDPTTGAPGMSIEDLYTLVEIEISAGTTGKPLAKGSQAVWAQILPLVQNTIKEIQQALAEGNAPVAEALTELVKETMRRMGDDTDITRFIPKNAPPGSPGSGARPPPIIPKVQVSLKGQIDPQTSDIMVQPVVDRDQVARPPGNPLLTPGADGPPGMPPPGLPGAAPGAPPGAAPIAPPPA